MRISVLLIVISVGVYSSGSSQTLIEQFKKIEEAAKPGWDLIDVSIGLGRLYMGTNDLEAGREMVSRINEQSELYDFPNGKAYALILENLEAYLVENDADKAIRLCKEAVSIAKETDDNNAYVYASYQLAENYIWEKGDVERGKEILLDVLDRFDDTVLAKNRASVYKVLGVAYDRVGDLETSLQYYEEARVIFQDLIENPPIDPRIGRVSTQNMDSEFHLGSVLDSMADSYLKQGDSEKAVEVRMQALEVYKQRNHAIDIAWVEGNLGEMFLSLGRYEESLEYLQSARATFIDLNSEVDIAVTNAVLISLFTELGEFEEAAKLSASNIEYYKRVDKPFLLAPTLTQAIRIALNQNDLAKAKELIDETVPVITALENQQRTAWFNQLRGNYYEAIEQFDRAKSFYKSCVELYEQTSDLVNVGNCELALGGVFHKANQYDSATVFITSALNNGALTSDLDLIADSFALLSNVYASRNDYKSAYETHQQYFAFNDSIFTADAQAKLKEEQVRQGIINFQKEKELAEQNAALLVDRNRMYIIAGIVLLFLLMIAIYLYINLNKIKAKVEAQNTQLMQLNATKDKFFGIIAHDLRSPLLGLQSVGNQISYYLKKDEKEKLLTLADRVENSSKKLTDLLDNLLNWALLQRGMIPFHPETIDLNDETNTTIELLEPVAEVKGVRLKNQIDGNAEVHADKKAVQTILRNIISNAIKYTDSGGEVAITLHDNGDTVTIAINDTGTGIIAEQLPTLFELNRKSKVGTSGEKGTGLGLVLCKELIELNNGQISAKSEPGKGSTFMFQFPKYKTVA